MKEKIVALTVSAFAILAASAEKLTVYPPATTVEEKIALAERTLEYVAKSVPAEQIKPLADELAIDKEWCAKAASPGEKYTAERVGHNGRDFIPGWKLIEFDPAGRVVWHWNAPWAGTPCAVMSFD